MPLLPAIPILLLFLATSGNRLQEDEIYWIGSAYYYHLAVIEHDAANADWQLLPARENPALGKYVIGAALHVFGRSIDTPDLLGSFYLVFAICPPWGTGDAYQKRQSVALASPPTLPNAFSAARASQSTKAICM